MKIWIRRSLIAAGSLAVVAAATLVTGNALATKKMQRIVDVKVAPLGIPRDAASIERGAYLYASRGCVDCHGANGAGRTFLDEGSLRVVGPHISPGAGSVTTAYTAEDWVRSIRHGVKPDGRPLMIMPSEDYNRFTDADLGALVAYLRQMPATDGGAAVIELPLLVRVLYAFGQIQDAAEKIDHSLPPPHPVPEGPTVEHGRYVAGMCVGCHGAQLSGGRIPGGPPDWPAAANLTPGSGTAMARYDDAQAFVRMMRSGQRPDGSKVAVMPFEALSKMNENDLRGLHAFLQTLPPRPVGGR